MNLTISRLGDHNQRTSTESAKHYKEKTVFSFIKNITKNSHVLNAVLGKDGLNVVYLCYNQPNHSKKISNKSKTFRVTNEKDSYEWVEAFKQVAVVNN